MGGNQGKLLGNEMMPGSSAGKCSEVDGKRITTSNLGLSKGIGVGFERRKMADRRDGQPGNIGGGEGE